MRRRNLGSIAIVRGTHGRLPPGSAVRPACAPQGSRLRRRRHPDAGHLPGGEHRDLHGGALRPAAAAALSRVEPAGVVLRRLPRRRRRAGRDVRPQLHGSTGDDRHLLVGRALPVVGLQVRRGRPLRADLVDERVAVVLPDARRHRHPRPAAERGRRDAGQEQGRRPSPVVRGPAAGGARRHRRARRPPQRRAVSRRRRPARVLQLPQPRGPRLHAAGLHPRGAP